MGWGWTQRPGATVQGLPVASSFKPVRPVRLVNKKLWSAVRNDTTIVFKAQQTPLIYVTGWQTRRFLGGHWYIWCLINTFCPCRIP